MLVLVLMENILQVVTEVLSGQEHATISLVMPLLTGLLEVHLVPSKVDDPTTATVKKALDPRFKDFHFFHNPIYQNILSGHALRHSLNCKCRSGRR